MKKAFFLTALIAIGVLAQAAFAQTPYTFSASPTSQNVSGGTFSVTFSLQAGSAGTVNAFDLYIATAAANSGLFTITSVSGIAPWTSSGPTIPGGGDPLSTPAASGFVRNGVDLGFSASPAQTAPFTQQVETINFSTTAAPGTYNFSSTTTANAGAFYSDASDNMGNTVEAGPGTFSITISPVPEPATWSLLALGSISSVGLNILRRRRAS